MLKPTKELGLFLFLLLGMIFIDCHAIQAEGVTLYTPNTKVSVAPGESVSYSIDVINNSKELWNEEISVTGIPRSWTYTLKSGILTIGQIAVLPGERKTLSLKVEIPFQVNKGNYRFSVTGGKSVSLPLTINISEKGTNQAELTTEQSNLEGNSKSSFNFKAKLQNRTADQQLYALMAESPRGWEVEFKVSGKQVSSVEMESNTTKDINIDVKPPTEIEAGTYKIFVSAGTESTSAKLELEVVITGTYSVELTTPTGLVSTTLTAGEGKRIEMVVKNTGSSELTGISLKASSPSNWNVEFDPQKVDKILPGKEATVYATIKADKKAIPGDYVTKIDVKTPETSSQIAFRVSVQTSMLWGWIGILIIIASLGVVFYLFRKYGRR